MAVHDESLSGWFRRLPESEGRRMRSSRGVSVTVIGTGGKTSLVWLLAESHRRRRVLVAPSAKMLIPGAGQYDIMIDSVPALLSGPVSAGITVAGRLDTAKLLSFPLDALEKAAARYDLVLMEGDGSQGRPLKGWADWEPVVPSFTDFTVGIIPIRPLGLPVSEATVHRLALFSALTGAAGGDIVRPAHLVSLVTGAFPPGGGRGLFAAARGKKILFINQVEDGEEMKKAEDLAAMLPGAFRKGLYAVLAGSVRLDGVAVL